MNRVYPPVRGATGRVLRDLASSFAREGWHVTVVTTGDAAGEERYDSVRIIRVKGDQKPESFFSYLWIMIKMMWVTLRLESRHVLVTMTDPPMLVVAGAFIARFKKCRHIHWCQDLYPEVLPALGVSIPDFAMRFLIKLRRNSMDKCDKVIVNGRCMADYLITDGLEARNIAMIPNWPDIELTDPEMIGETGESYLPVDENMGRPFDEQKKNGRKFRVIYAGNIGRAHPISTIIDAAEILDEEKSDIEFVFVGDGKRYDDLVQERSKRGVDNIRVLPYQPLSRLRETMESGDVHLVSMREKAAGFVVPSKLYAALAVARPTVFIGPDATETAQVIKDYKAGLIVDNNDAKGLADAIRAYREDSSFWVKAHKGAAEAREVFTPKDSIDAWIDRAWAIVSDKERA